MKCSANKPDYSRRFSGYCRGMLNLVQDIDACFEV